METISLMLSDKIKTAIRTSYKAIGENLPNFNPRKQQTFLIAEIAKTLAGNYHRTERIAVIEAGTGTGKSLAYCIGAIPYAKQHKKNLIISTATVALQEQLINKELPFFAKNSGIEISFELAKGRQRYVCAERLYNALVDDPSQLNFLATTDAPLNEKEQDSLNKTAVILGDENLLIPILNSIPLK